MSPRRILSAALAAVMVLTLTPVTSPQGAVFAEDPASAAPPSILRQPADATYAENATARFYVSASSPEGGLLTYQWYRSGPFATKYTNPNGDDSAAITGAGTVIANSDSATITVLTTKTSAVNGTS
jgi:hypothetical protein